MQITRNSIDTAAGPIEWFTDYVSDAEYGAAPPIDNGPPCRGLRPVADRSAW